MWVRNCRGRFLCNGQNVACGFPPGLKAYTCSCSGGRTPGGGDHASTRDRAHWEEEQANLNSLTDKTWPYRPDDLSDAAVAWRNLSSVKWALGWMIDVRELDLRAPCDVVGE